MAPATVLTAQAVADLVGGRLLGDGGVRLSAVAPLDRAGPSSISFATSARYRAALSTTGADAVLVTEDLVPSAPERAVRIVVVDPARAIAVVTAALFPVAATQPNIDPTARLGPGVTLAADVVIGPWAVLGAGASLGARTCLGPGVVLGDGVSLGADCNLGAHVVCEAGTSIGDRAKRSAAVPHRRSFRS